MQSFYRMWVGPVRVAKVPAEGLSTVDAMLAACLLAIPVPVSAGARFGIELDGKPITAGIFGVTAAARVKHPQQKPQVKRAPVQPPVQQLTYAEEQQLAVAMWRELEKQ